MRWPWQRRLDRRRVRAALAGAARARLATLKRRELGLGSGRRLRQTPLALARFVALDLETTGPRMDRDRVIAVGAIAVAGRALVHGEAFTAVLRQASSSARDNILVHRISGQEQLAGLDPVATWLAFLEFRGASFAVAFRSEFDATVLERELDLTLGIRVPRRFVDLAVLLPALFPGTANDTLEDWLGHFALEPIGRHEALADAYSAGQLLLIALDAAQRLGMRTTGDLLELERAQRWLGRRR
jgi:DNA polymerase-3 subunit epsilon